MTYKTFEDWEKPSSAPSEQKILNLIDKCTHDLLELSMYLTEVMYGNITINAIGGKFVWIPDKGDTFLSQSKSQIVEQILGMMKESHIKYADTREGLRYLIQNDPEVSISLEWELGYNTAINHLRLQIKEEINKL